MAKAKPFDVRLDDKSRMKREFHVRFCERPWGKFPGPTRLNSEAVVER